MGKEMNIHYEWIVITIINLKQQKLDNKCIAFFEACGTFKDLKADQENNHTCFFTDTNSNIKFQVACMGFDYIN